MYCSDCTKKQGGLGQPRTTNQPTSWFAQLNVAVCSLVAPSYHSYVLLCSLRNAVRTRLAGDDGSLLPEHGLIFSPKTAKFGTFRERDTHVARMSPLGKTST